MILNITKNLVHLQQTVPIKKIRKNNENKRERLFFLTSWSLINKVFEKDLSPSNSKSMLQIFRQDEYFINSFIKSYISSLYYDSGQELKKKIPIPTKRCYGSLD